MGTVIIGLFVIVGIAYILATALWPINKDDYEDHFD